MAVLDVPGLKAPRAPDDLRRPAVRHTGSALLLVDAARRLDAELRDII
jgi:hypothetical protein